jgi:hypothetical protein
MGEEEIGASYRWRSRGGVGKVTDQGAERVWEGSWAPRRNRSANGDDVDLLMLHDWNREEAERHGERALGFGNIEQETRGDRGDDVPK